MSETLDFLTRQLLGGIDAWRERKYPTEPPVAAAANLSNTAATSNK